MFWRDKECMTKKKWNEWRVQRWDVQERTTGKGFWFKIWSCETHFPWKPNYRTIYIRKATSNSLELLHTGILRGILTRATTFSIVLASIIQSSLLKHSVNKTILERKIKECRTSSESLHRRRMWLRSRRLQKWAYELGQTHIHLRICCLRRRRSWVWACPLCK